MLISIFFFSLISCFPEHPTDYFGKANTFYTGWSDPAKQFLRTIFNFKCIGSQDPSYTHSVRGGSLKQIFPLTVISILFLFFPPCLDITSVYLYPASNRNGQKLTNGALENQARFPLTTCNIYSAELLQSLAARANHASEGALPLLKMLQSHCWHFPVQQGCGFFLPLHLITPRSASLRI